MSSFNALRCDFCDGNLVIDDSREFAICEFCGTKYMASTLRAKIQEIKGTVKVEGAVETTTGDAERERIASNADKLFRLKKYKDAVELYKQLTRQFPDDYRGWFGLYKISITDILNEKPTIFDKVPSSDDDNLETAFNLCNDKQDIFNFFNSIINLYGDKIHIVRIDEFNYKNIKDKIQFINYNNIEIMPFIIDRFTAWVLFSSTKTREIIEYKPFEAFKTNLSKQYMINLYNGLIAPFMIKKIKDWDYDLQIINPIDEKEIKCANLSYLPIYFYLKKVCKVETSNDNNGNEHHITFGGYVYLYTDSIYNMNNAYILGKTLLLKTRPQSVFKASCIFLPTAVTEQNINMNYNIIKGVCQHCGGKFKGVFSKICSQCGKPKDY